MKIQAYIEKLQNLPEQKKKTILWAVVSVIGLAMAIFWINGVINTFSEMGKSAQVVAPAINNASVAPEIASPQISEWKTYASEAYGYEIKLPTEYQSSSVFANQGVSDLEQASYVGKDYAYSFQVFARDQDWIVKDCLNNLKGSPITDKKEINGAIFFAFKDRQVGMGNKEPILGSLESEYHVLHNNKCYFINYSIYPNNSGVNDSATQFSVLEQIFSTFKFTAVK